MQVISYLATMWHIEGMRVVFWVCLVVIWTTACGRQPMHGLPKPSVISITKPAPKTQREHKVEVCLDDTSADACMRRATIARCGASAVEARFINDKSSKCTNDKPPQQDVTVVDQSKKVVRILAEHYSVRYLLYVRTRDLALRPISRVGLRLHAEKPVSENIALLPGAPVAVNESMSGLLHIKLEHMGVAVSGWISALQMGPVYVLQPMKNWDDRVDIKGDTPVLDRVGGEEVAKLKQGNFFDRRIRVISKTLTSHAKIEVVTYAPREPHVSRSSLSS